MNEPIDELLFRYLERVDGGESADGVLAELIREQPEYGERLRRGVAILRDARLHPGPKGEGLPERIGGFRLLRRLGGGGMGVVYTAQEERPARRVALKLVRPDFLHAAGARARFEREVASAARLSHPGIARALACGEHEGVPWFSQELISGASLEEVLRSLPARRPEGLTGADLRAALADAIVTDDTPPESSWNEEFFEGTWPEICTRIARQIAEALQHAHERGVVHRDVKPSNVLLTPSGRAVIVDLGLASLAGSEVLTRTGSLLGSLPYLSPEQLAGEVREARPPVDVYGLGVTLYELLTLRQPYSSPSVERLRKLILGGNAPSARELNGDVSRDLATVCARAMEPERERRYASAAAVAGELANVLARRPIAARPMGRVLRFLRWTQRRPALAVSLLIGLPLAIAGPTAFAVQRSMAAEALAARNVELSSSIHATDELFANALEALDHVVIYASGESLKDIPRVTRLRVELADYVLAAINPIGEARLNDPRVVIARAAAYRARASARRDGGVLEEAAADYERMLAALDELELESLDPEVLSLFGVALNAWGATVENTGRPQRAAQLYARSVELLQAAVDSGFEQPKGSVAVAFALSNLARMRAETGDEQGREEAFEDALFAAEELFDLHAENPLVLDLLARMFGTRAWVSAERGDFESALLDRHEATGLAELALDTDPASRIYRLRCAEAWSGLGQVASMMERYEEAEIAQERALELYDAYLLEFPEEERIHVARAKVRGVSALIAQAIGKDELARELMSQVAAEQTARAHAQPKRFDLAFTATTAQLNLAGILCDSIELGPERLEQALAAIDRARELLAPVATASPQLPRVQKLVFYTEARYGAAHALAGRPQVALSHAEAMNAVRQPLPEQAFAAAQTWALWAGAALEVAGEGERDALFERGSREVCAALEAALEAGFADLRRLLAAREFERFEDLPCFVTIIERLGGLEHAR